MRKCKLCGNKYENKYNSLAPCPNHDCRVVLFNQALEKVRKQKEKELKEKYEKKHKKPSEYEAEAKKVFQKWVRLRDKDLPCISCGSNTSNPFWDGGHYKKAEIYSGVIFNHDNCHKQCRKCNFYENGNEANYRSGLVKRIGLERVEQLEELSDLVRRKKYTREELIEIKNIYSTKIKNKDFSNGII